ncbi:hypothetical protein EDF60_1461 [Leucobacter luti]|uniref:hypothetical protein n=1 Tax=Leucobacter luti TaxID=340320 RepID=UPI00104FDED6|nr:hypothetical protein [Leucobacter luti]MCW2287623.1 Na+-translocating ferredoxin:NAD+ oxidoreductase RnfD subunit [Leucobacter luti]TCK46209.1 hypothetical protein EDF60_1461 [Leucobacter luti]
MGFSWLGLAVSGSIMLPNLLLLVLPPRPPVPTVSVSAPLSWTERLGQALCVAVSVCTVPGSIALGWGVVLGVSVLGYWLLWARYVRHRTPFALFGRVWGVPVPMAVLPVIAFLSTGLFLGAFWICAAAVVLAIGHIPVSLQRARALSRS